MKRAAFVILILLAALLVMAYQPPHYVRTLELQAAQGDWVAAWRLADYYGASPEQDHSGYLEPRSMPAAARLVRPVQKSTGMATYWERTAAGLLFERVREDDPEAIAVVAFDNAPFLGRQMYFNDRVRSEYLVRLLLHPDMDEHMSGYALHVLAGLDSVLADLTIAEADRAGLLWPALRRIRDYSADGDWDRWIEEWATTLERHGSAARLDWIRSMAMAQKEAAAGNQSSVDLLEKIRTYDRAHPGVRMLDV